jgi:hypothetical protein
MEKLPKLNKMQAMQHLLSAHNSIYVHVDTRRSGVMLPEQLMGKPQITLQVGYHMPVPIRDLNLDSDGWSATLLFGRTQFFVSETGIGYHWPSDTPPEITIQRRDEVGTSTSTKATAAIAKAKARGWRVIDGDKGKDDADGGGKDAG